METIGNDLLTTELARHYRIVPRESENGSFCLYIDGARFNETIKEELEILFGQSIELFPIESHELEKYLATRYLASSEQDLAEMKSISNTDFVSDLIQQAQGLKSSDIHIEIYDQKCRVRFRMDGKLVEINRLRKEDYPTLINKIKIMAGLDISEKRLPQDGRINHKSEDRKVDIRVSVLPTLYGEKIVLRILGTSASHLDLDDLGMSAIDLQRYKEGTKKPNGIILISGPTGSGKTTTLYATLKLLNKNTANILTIEDPIEYTLEGINQVQAKEDIGLTFSRVLKTFLRQDPDIIMVGEIRDPETAGLAIRAALTGHLVLSTIHTNSAWSTISRLMDMGIPSFLIANTLNATVAQRLLRVLCNHCKRKEKLSESRVPDSLKSDMPHEHHVAVGCQDCYFTGYAGRQAIYEVIPVNPQVADLIVKASRDVDGYFHSLKIKTLRSGAWDVFKKGQTSLEEIYPLLLDEQY